MDAVLWDMDGLMVDSEPLWTRAEEELARTLGGTWDSEVKARIVGTRLDVAVPTILTYFGVEADDERVRTTAAWLLHRMVELFSSDDLPLLPGVRSLLAGLADEQVPMALVSSSYRVLVDAVLAGGVGPFAVTLAGDEVERGKPAPDPYQLAASRLGVDVTRCVVLEDSPAGVASGEAAGCAVVAVPSVPGVRMAPAPRRLVVPSLADLAPSDLRALV